MFCFFIQAQDYKVLYEIKWKPSIEKDSIYTELGALAIDGSQSYFALYDNFKTDSLKSKIVNSFLEGNGNNELRFPSPSEKINFKKIILKNTASDSIVQEEKLYINTFKIQSSCKPIWELKDEKKEIFNYECKKAITEFAGRKWIAWYTQEIPIPDGPYKFYGLPGLILSITDEKADYHFEIKGITKEKKDLKHRDFALPKPIILNQKKWNVFYQKYQKNPSIILENLNTENTTYVINGKDINKNTKKEYNERMKKFFKEHNNPIELKDDCR